MPATPCARNCFYNKEMLLRRLGTFSVAGCLLAALPLAFAQNWKTAATLPGVDFSGLTPKAKANVLKILRERGCSCGCSMKLAECRIADPGCAYSTNLAATAVAAAKAGKSDAEIVAALEGSKWAHMQEEAPHQVLDPAIKIPVAGAPVMGPATAKITIVEFSDFQCPYCAGAVAQVNQILKAYPTQVKLIFKQFPLEIHPQADFAAAAAVAAQKQGKFWQLHDLMFANQRDLSRKSILAMAQQAGIDMQRFEADIESTEVRETVVRDVQDGNQANVEGTPTFFINGQKYNGALALSEVKPIIDNELKLSQTASR
jgi:protein-disulfide isomerase